MSNMTIAEQIPSKRSSASPLLFLSSPRLPHPIPSILVPSQSIHDPLLFPQISPSISSHSVLTLFPLYHQLALHNPHIYVKDHSLRERNQILRRRKNVSSSWARKKAMVVLLFFAPIFLLSAAPALLILARLVLTWRERGTVMSLLLGGITAWRISYLEN